MQRHEYWLARVSEQGRETAELGERVRDQGRRLALLRQQLREREGEVAAHAHKVAGVDVLLVVDEQAQGFECLLSDAPDL